MADCVLDFYLCVWGRGGGKERKRARKKGVE